MLVLCIVEQTPIPREPRFSLSTGHFGTCFVWSSSNRAQSHSSELMREMDRNFIIAHVTGEVRCPFQPWSTLLGTGRWEEDAPLPSCLFGSVPFFLTSPKATCSVEETDFPREQDYCQSVCTRVWVPLTSLLFSSLPTRSSTLDFFFSQHTPSSMTDLTIIHVFSHAAFDSALCGFSQNVAASQERTINLLFIH